MSTRTQKKYFSVEEANRMLPLIRRIVRDVLAGYGRLREHFNEMQEKPGVPDVQDRFEEARADLEEVIDELVKLGLELKSLELGLVDFPHMRDGREVYLCWKSGEDRVAYWHEIDTGYAGRQPLG